MIFWGNPLGQTLRKTRAIATLAGKARGLGA